MAEIIPDAMPSGASQGEKRVFCALQALADDCVVFYEAAVNRRYPDFIVILPRIGVLIIEVKGWYLTQIQKADTQLVTLHENGLPTEYKNPDRQARDYVFQLMDTARAFPSAACLMNDQPPYQGRFSFPFSRLTVLSNITRSQLDSERPDLSALFSAPGVATRDELFAWLEMDGDQLEERLRTAFDPVWPIKPLTAQQVNTLRGILHPQMVLENTEAGLKLLDLRQARHAQAIGEGHRIIYGVAGSGKTVILTARAKILAGDPEKRILLLCFNRLLAQHLAAVLKPYPNITVSSFYRWGIGEGAEFREGESHEAYGDRLRACLERMSSSAGTFDAVLIDEGQDFACSWFQCARLALKEPDDGDLLIVADGSQSIFRARPFTWKEAGINAVGRVLNRKFDLDRNYRNTVEILGAAYSFAGSGESKEAESDRTLRLPVTPASALRHGPRPQVIQCRDRVQECETVAGLVREWLTDGIADGQGGALQAGEIAVLYPRLMPEDEPVMDRLRHDLDAFTRAVSLTRGTHAKLADEGVKLMTMMAVKGLQFRAVIMMWADLLPSPFRDRDEPNERMQFYVSMTRAEDNLVITHSKPSRYVEEVQRNMLSDAAHIVS